ncbi:MAG: RHS repeat-associated core domain-containing protein [Chitinophagales bacterium]|nr:RHS repeat-associated core domain-containing protein [Chitinophagales bacterium]
MKIRSTTILVSMLLLFAAAVSAQPVNSAVQSTVMATPNAAALGKYGDIPVSLHTGVPNIGIPITTVQEGPLSLPISLSYHASGIKMAEPASWVGLGWALNAGGAISRTVQGRPDEKGLGYYSDPTPVPSPMTTAQVNFYANQGDPEPDIFSFNVGGYAGKFYFNKDKQVILVPKQDIKISVRFDSQNGIFNYFLMVMPDGTKYYFGGAPTDAAGTNMAREQSTIENPTGIVTSSWYLRRIETHDGYYNISLNYVDENYSFTTPATCTHTKASCSGFGYEFTNNSVSCAQNAYNATHYYNRVIVLGKRLISVESSTSVVNFQATTDRLDMEVNNFFGSPALPKRLDKIQIVQSSDICAEFRFTYDYFVDPGHTTKAEGKRLRLLKLQEVSCDNTVLKEPFNFSYYGSTNILRWRLSHNVDHWGYANAGNNEGLSINIPPTTVVVNGTAVSFGSADRGSSESQMQEGVLTKIEYPTGGNTQFTYEANDYPVSENYTYNSYLLQVSNCTFPHVCCGSTTGEDSRSFTSQELSTARYKFSLIRPNCYSANCSPEFPLNAQLQVFKMPENTLISSSIVLNIFNSVCEDTIGGMLVNLLNLQPGVTYKFRVQGFNGKGNFQIFTYSQGTNIFNKKAGGLRIKEIRSHDGINTANDIIRSYEYKSEYSPTTSSGSLFYQPFYGYSIANPNFYAVLFRDQAIEPMGSFDSYHIGYSTVIEKLNGIGKVTHHFNVEVPAVLNTFPVTPFEARINSGFEIQSKNYDEGGSLVASANTLIQPDTYDPANGSGNNKVKIVSIPINCPGATYAAVSPPYTMRTKFLRSASVTKTIDGVSTTVNYSYGSGTSLYAPHTSESITNSDGISTTIEYIYPWANTQTGTVIDSLRRRNIIGAPLITTVKVNNVLVDGSRTLYALFRRSDGLKANIGEASVDPYPWQNLRYEATFDAAGNIASGAMWDLQDETSAYWPSGNAGKGYPKTWTQKNWPSETYEWESAGRLRKRTYLNFIQEYTWQTGTRLLVKEKGIDGQETWTDYDKLGRVIKTWARPGTAGSKTSAKVTTEYEYRYKNASTPNNYIRTKTTFAAAPTGGGSSGLSNVETFQYIDGLGRLIQTVGKQQSPTLKDVVSVVQYDKWGRESRMYNPFEATTNTGAFAAAVPAGTPFTLTEYYADPTSRPWKTTPPEWYATTLTYGSNAANEVLQNHSTNTFYPAGSLTKNTITDADNKQVINYIDKKGRLILQRRTDVGNSGDARTYTLYDAKDRPVTVIPPSSTLNNSSLNFSYTYDGSDNILTKKIPDAAVISYRYNTRDLLTVEQDGNLAGLSQWRCMQYDDYGRVIKAGLYSGTVPTSGGIATSFAPTTVYTERQYGTTGIEIGKVKIDKVKVLDAAGTWLQTTFSYDQYGRVSNISGNNYLLPTDYMAENSSFLYDFADNGLQEIRTSKKTASVAYTLTQKHNYDHWGRNTQNAHRVGSGQEMVLNQINYNWKNEVVEKNVGKTPTATQFLQSLDYTYNAQGWLKTINAPTLGGSNVGTPVCPTNPSLPNPGVASSTPDANDLFYLELKYDQPESVLGGTAAKNGNISQAIWRVRGRERQAYVYSYDYLNRLSAATYRGLTDANAISNDNAWNEGAGYDIRGNITNLGRGGRTLNDTCWQDGIIDFLAYEYYPNSNRLRRITDNAPAATKTEGWHNTRNAPATAEYSYDANGNMISDPYKGMTVTYNFLNLPTQMLFTNGSSQQKIEILYAGNGQKIRKTTSVNNNFNYSIDYLGELEYRSSPTVALSLESIYHEEGRVFNTNVGTSGPDALRYEYVIRDHLGNTRLSFTDKNGDGKVNVLNTLDNELLQENHYYPFGLTMRGPWVNDEGLGANRYLYNAKEFNSDFGLKWLDYGARWYDPAVSRWWGVDLMAEVDYAKNPYHYVKNSPVLYVDPLGLSSSTQPLSPPWPALTDGGLIPDFTPRQLRGGFGFSNDYRVQLSRFIPGDPPGGGGPGDGATPEKKSIFSIDLDPFGYWKGKARGWTEAIIGLGGGFATRPILDIFADDVVNYIFGERTSAIGETIGWWDGFIGVQAASSAFGIGLGNGGFARGGLGIGKSFKSGLGLGNAAETGTSLGAGRIRVKQWLQNVGNLERDQLIKDIEGAGFKKVFDGKGMMHFQRGGIKIRVDPPQPGTPFDHMHINYGGNKSAYDVFLKPVNFKSPAAHIPIK